MQSSSEKIILGTRGSKLALWQAHFTKDLLEKRCIAVELKIITTKGDITHHLSFDKIEGKGFFTKEIEDALLANEIDLAVHSCKDMPTEYPEGLTLAAFSYRASVEDVLIIRNESSDYTKELLLKKDAVVGTSSSRRKAQLLSYRPDIQLKDIRGNVPSRIQKLRNGEFDAILLAAAGLERLEIELDDLIKLELDPQKFVPAPAQGILAYQIREVDRQKPLIAKAIDILNNPEGSAVAHLERSVLQAFKGGCQVPIGIYARKTENPDEFDLWVSKAESWDSLPKRHHQKVNTKNFDAQAIVQKVNEAKPKTVFITREITDSDFLCRVLNAHQYRIEGESLIEFSPVSFTNKDFEKAEWLFFSSKVAVDYFFKSINRVSDKFKIAAINEGTARSLKDKGMLPAFIGTGNDMDEVAHQFAKLNPSQIYFPCAKNGRRTIQQNLIKLGLKEVNDLFIYDNQPKSKVEAVQEDLLIFTSPLNVQAYFKGNKLNDIQKVISIGKTTSKALEEKNIPHITSYSPTEWSIADAVFSL